MGEASLDFWLIFMHLGF